MPTRADQGRLRPRTRQDPQQPRRRQPVDLFTRRMRDRRLSSDYAVEIEELGPRGRIVRLPCVGKDAVQNMSE